MDRLSLLKEFLDERDIWCYEKWLNSDSSGSVKALRLDSHRIDLFFSVTEDRFHAFNFSNEGDLWCEGPKGFQFIGNVADPTFFQKVLLAVGD
jgi:hypothetical protein